MQTKIVKVKGGTIAIPTTPRFMRLAALEENQDIVRRAARESNPYLAPYLVKSLRQGVGYYQLMGTMYFRPCTSADFYGYRRKALAAFDRLLMGEGDRIMDSLIEEGQGRMALKQP